MPVIPNLPRYALWRPVTIFVRVGGVRLFAVGDGRAGVIAVRDHA